MLVGVILLNPRIMEYDAAPVTLLLALIAWRLFARFTTVSNTMICMALLIAVTNGIAAFGWYIRKLVDGPLLVVVFAAGCWTLLQYSETPAVEPEYELALP
jgi:CHASE2 domain-containing sensor protein